MKMKDLKTKEVAELRKMIQERLDSFILRSPWSTICVKIKKSKN